MPSQILCRTRHTNDRGIDNLANQALDAVPAQTLVHSDAQLLAELVPL
jgi:hypothetical protein